MRNWGRLKHFRLSCQSQLVQYQLTQHARKCGKIYLPRQKCPNVFPSQRPTITIDTAVAFVKINPPPPYRHAMRTFGRIYRICSRRRKKNHKQLHLASAEDPSNQAIDILIL